MNEIRHSIFFQMETENVFVTVHKYTCFHWTIVVDGLLQNGTESDPV